MVDGSRRAKRCFAHSPGMLAWQEVAESTLTPGVPNSAAMLAADPPKLFDPVVPLVYRTAPANFSRGLAGDSLSSLGR